MVKIGQIACQSNAQQRVHLSLEPQYLLYTIAKCQLSSVSYNTQVKLGTSVNKLVHLNTDTHTQPRLIIFYYESI